MRSCLITDQNTCKTSYDSSTADLSQSALDNLNGTFSLTIAGWFERCATVVFHSVRFDEVLKSFTCDSGAIITDNTVRYSMSGEHLLQ